jgi:hypothetical protein
MEAYRSGADCHRDCSDTTAADGPGPTLRGRTNSSAALATTTGWCWSSGVTLPVFTGSGDVDDTRVISRPRDGEGEGEAVTFWIPAIAAAIVVGALLGVWLARRG